MHFHKRRRCGAEIHGGETPVQVVRGTENHKAMRIMDRIALDRARAQLPPVTGRFSPFTISKDMSIVRSPESWVTRYQPRSHSCIKLAGNYAACSDNSEQTCSRLCVR